MKYCSSSSSSRPQSSLYYANCIQPIGLALTFICLCTYLQCCRKLFNNSNLFIKPISIVIVLLKIFHSSAKTNEALTRRKFPSQHLHFRPWVGSTQIRFRSNNCHFCSPTLIEWNLFHPSKFDINELSSDFCLLNPKIAHLIPHNRNYLPCEVGIGWSWYTIIPKFFILIHTQRIILHDNPIKYPWQGNPANHLELDRFWSIIRQLMVALPPPPPW